MSGMKPFKSVYWNLVSTMSSASGSPDTSESAILLRSSSAEFSVNKKKRSLSCDVPIIPDLRVSRSTSDIKTIDNFGSYHSVKTGFLSTRSESSLSQYFSLETLIDDNTSISNLDDFEENKRDDKQEKENFLRDEKFAKMSKTSPEKTNLENSPSSTPEKKKKGIRLLLKKKKSSKVKHEDGEISDDVSTDNIESNPVDNVGSQDVQENDKITSQSSEHNSQTNETGSPVSVSQKLFNVLGFGKKTTKEESETENVESGEEEEHIEQDSEGHDETSFFSPSSTEPNCSNNIKTVINVPSQSLKAPSESKTKSTQSIAEEIEEAEKKETHPYATPHSLTQAGSSTGKREYLYKILVIGDLGAGKTSIIKRYVHQFFSQHYRATIGVDFALKVLNWDDETIVRLQLWDIAGQERFGNMTRVYYKEAVGAFIVFDVTRSQTFDAILKWKTDLDSKVSLPNGGPIPVVLLANKCDQTKEGPITKPSEIDSFCKENEFSGWFETSAKDNINIEEASKFLVTKILRYQREGLMVNETVDSSKFTIKSDTIDSPKRKSKCPC